MILRRGLFIAIGIVIGLLHTGKAQILDDSTKQVYGPATTLYTTGESVWLYNGQYQPIDTSVLNQHRFTYNQMAGNRYQDLGNVGTAKHHLWANAPEVTGLRSGFDAYNLYWTTPANFKYYQTKSPYTKLLINFGGNGRSTVGVNFARNINPYWNVGFNFETMAVDKQVGADRSRGDRNVENTTYNFFVRYMRPDSSYQLLFHANRMRHSVSESGGIIHSLDTSEFALLFDEDARIWLTESNSIDLRQAIHLYHQYSLNKYMTLYHALDRYKQQNEFENLSLQQEDEFFDQVLITDDSTTDMTRYRYFQNHVGIKGDIGSIAYDMYYKRREVKFVHRYLPVVGPVTENYGGFNLRFTPGKVGQLHLFGEYLQGGQYKAGGTLQHKLLEARVKRTVYRPALMRQDYFGNHDEWHNAFTDVNHDELDARLNLKFGEVRVAPKVGIDNITDPVYFNRQAVPEQFAGSAQVLSAGLETNIPLGRLFNFSADVTFTSVSGDAADVYRIPDIFANAQLYYKNLVFGGNLETQIGFDLHWKSDYVPLAYDPVVQQFYLQDAFEVPNYVVADFFANLKINKALVFVKMTNLLQGLQADGYIITPFYIGQPRTLDVGIRWLFFD